MTEKKKTSPPRTAEDNPRYIHISMTKDHIVVFKFDRLSRIAFQEYLAYIRKYNGQYPDPLRVMYDLRGAGMPGLPFIELIEQASDGIDIPSRFRAAHVVDDLIFKQFVKLYLSRLTVTGYDHRIFIKEDKALEWLRQPFED